jgi:hypothetical protein
MEAANIPKTSVMYRTAWRNTPETTFFKCKLKDVLRALVLFCLYAVTFVARAVSNSRYKA